MLGTYLCILSVVTLVFGLQVFDPCGDKDRCPEGSICTYRGCDGRLCLCNDGLLPNVNRTRCVQGISLGSGCTSESVCRGQPFSKCIDNICRCIDSYRETTSPAGIGSHCLPKPQGSDVVVQFGDVNEVCNDIDRQCSFDLECRNGTCNCPINSRLATNKELAASPYSYLLCRPQSFKLGIPVNTSSEECKNQVASTTPGLSTSTTVIKSTTPKPTTSSQPTTSTKKSTTTPTTQTTTTKTTTTTAKPTTTTTTTTTTRKPTSATKISTIKTTQPQTTSTTLTSTVTPPRTKSTSTATTRASPISTSLQTTPVLSSTSKISTSTKMSTSKTTKTEIRPSSTTSKISSTSQAVETTHSTAKLLETTMFHTTEESSTGSPRSVSTISTATVITSTQQHSMGTNSSILKNLTSSTQAIASNTRVTTMPLSRDTMSTQSTANITVHLGENCSGRMCPNNSDCEEDVCGEKRCRCKLGYAENAQADSCFKLVALGDTCTGDRICQGPFTECTESGICECLNEYERSDTGKWCRLKSGWLVNFPLLGESCSGGFFSSCYMDFEQECVSSRCKCKDGGREVGHDDRFAMYPDIRQCRNNSYTPGEREKNICKNQSRQSFSADIYDKAKAKIKKMQGAIIGGSVGFLVLVGILIGLVVLIRWKRRGKRQVIRDTSSMASSERYSFKIPRPFTHYVGAKEYDSQQIAYPNPIFQSDSTSGEPRPDVVNVSGDASSLLTSNDN